MGKGSKQRPTDKAAFDSNFDQIFGAKSDPKAARVEALKQRMLQHDYWYAYSDDHRVYTAGGDSWRAISEEAQALGRDELLRSYVNAKENNLNVEEALGL